MLKTLIPPFNNNKVTVELRELVESGINIWDFDYPSFYQGEEKRALEQKVIDHYYFRQIGQETPGRFLHYFRARVREIMPYYIKRWESVKLMDEVGDPFEAYNLTETYTESHSREGNVSASDNSSSTSSSSAQSTSEASGSSNRAINDDKLNKFSNTPVGEISNIDNMLSELRVEENTTGEDISTEENSSSESTVSATVTGTGSSENSSSESGTLTHTLTRKGNIGVQPLGQEINAYRSALINVDLEFIEALNNLFLLVY